MKSYFLNIIDLSLLCVPQQNLLQMSACPFVFPVGILATIFFTYRKNNVSAICLFMSFMWFSVSTAFSFLRMADAFLISTENYSFFAPFLPFF